jgi:hypothetical protein
VSAHGQCCGLPQSSDSVTYTGPDAAFSYSTPRFGHTQDNYNYFSCSASQTSQIDPGHIFGFVAAGAGARNGGGGGPQSSSDARSGLGVFFDIAVRSSYQMSATYRGNYFGGGPQGTLSRNGVNIFAFNLGDPFHPNYAGSGSLAPGRYHFTIDAFAIGTEFYSGPGCEFDMVVASTCACDWNHDSRLDSADFFSFLTDFFALNADYNHSGSTDSADFFDFLSCFFTSCV